MVNLVDWASWVNRLKNVATELHEYVSGIDFKDLSYEQMVELNNWLTLLLNTLGEIKVEQLNSVVDKLIAIHDYFVSELNARNIPSFDVTGSGVNLIADKFLRETMQQDLFNELKRIKDFADITLRRINEIYTESPDALYSDFENSKDKVLVYFYLMHMYDDTVQLLDDIDELLNRFAYLRFLDVAKNRELRRLMQEYISDIDNAMQKVEQLINDIGDNDLRLSFEQLLESFGDLSTLNKIIITANILHNSGYDDNYIEQYEKVFDNKVILASDFIINFKDLLESIKKRLKSKK